jgi:hypothetical protein
MKLIDAVLFMPDEFESRFIEDFDNPNQRELEIYPDPNVQGTFAIRVDSDTKEPIDLLWSHGDFEDVEFSSWPPTSSSNLYFF